MREDRHKCTLLVATAARTSDAHEAPKAPGEYLSTMLSIVIHNVPKIGRIARWRWHGGRMSGTLDWGSGDLPPLRANAVWAERGNAQGDKTSSAITYRLMPLGSPPYQTGYVCERVGQHHVPHELRRPNSWAFWLGAMGSRQVCLYANLTRF